MTNYRILVKPSATTLAFYHFKMSANIILIKWQKIKIYSLKESINIKKFRPKIRIYVPCRNGKSLQGNI